jgi:histidine ammonia-lyase
MTDTLVSILPDSDMRAAPKALLRAEVSFYDKDRYFAPDIEKATRLIQSAAYNRFAVTGMLPSL